MTESVAGLARLTRKLKAMAPKVIKRVADALVKSAEEVNQAQRALAERSRRSGKLIEGIGWEHGVTQLIVLIFSRSMAKGEEYSHFVEWGTAHAAAEPFFFPGYRLMKKRVKTRIKTAISKACREAASAS